MAMALETNYRYPDYRWTKNTLVASITPKRLVSCLLHPSTRQKYFRGFLTRFLKATLLAGSRRYPTSGKKRFYKRFYVMNYENPWFRNKKKTSGLRQDVPLASGGNPKVFFLSHERTIPRKKSVLKKCQRNECYKNMTHIGIIGTSLGQTQNEIETKKENHIKGPIKRIFEDSS
jgi:hypothetical protein